MKRVWIVLNTAHLAMWLSVSIFVVGCGGTEKGKNKDLDRPKATER